MLHQRQTPHHKPLFKLRCPSSSCCQCMSSINWSSINGQLIKLYGERIYSPQAANQLLYRFNWLSRHEGKEKCRANQDYEQTMEVEDTLNENYGSDSQQRNDTDSDDRTMDVNNNQQGGETTSPGKSKMSFTHPLFWKMAIKSVTTCGAKHIEDQGHVLPDYEKNNLCSQNWWRTSGDKSMSTVRNLLHPYFDPWALSKIYTRRTWMDGYFVVVAVREKLK